MVPLRMLPNLGAITNMWDEEMQSQEKEEGLLQINHLKIIIYKLLINPHQAIP